MSGNVIDSLLSDTHEALARRGYPRVAGTVAALMKESGLSKEQERALAQWVLAANVQALEMIRHRVLGRSSSTAT